ncbi:ABC transporter, partial [Tsukamurella tyrosinosolvens]
GLAGAVAAIAAAGPTELAVHPPSLEQLFLGHYRDEADSAERAGIAEPSGSSR